MEYTPLSPQVNKKKSNKVLKIIPWVGLVLFVVVAAAGGYLYATRQLVFAFGGSTETPVTVVSSVCGKDTIKKFNNAYNVATVDERTSAFKSAFDAVTNTPGYASDPNCVFIRYTHYIELKDAANAQKEVDVLKSLAAKNLYATSQMINVRSIESMQSEIKILSVPAGQTQDGAGSSGQG